MTEKLYNTIVVGTDGTECAQKAVTTAIELSKLVGAKLHVVYVSDVSNITPTSVEWELVAENIRMESEKAFEFARKKSAAENIDFEAISLSGAAGQEIVVYANKINADLIVVGATGKKAFERLILGSVSEKVIRNAKKQVLVVRSDDA